VDLPVKRVSSILGNNLTGGKVVPNPAVCKEPRLEEPDGLSEKYPPVFPVCAVTSAMSKKVAGSKSSVEEDVSDPTMFDLSETFMCDPDFGKPPELTFPLKTPKMSKFVGPLKEERVPTVDTSISRK
jgi:hypothetical protein